MDYLAILLPLRALCENNTYKFIDIYLVTVFELITCLRFLRKRTKILLEALLLSLQKLLCVYGIVCEVRME